MSADLRAPLARSFERLHDDLVIGRHGDPHVAFAVLVYPDREPAIIAVTAAGSGAHDIGVIVTSEREDAERKAQERGRFFTAADLAEASHALHDASFALRVASWSAKGRKLGEYVTDEIRRQWHSRRDNSLKSELEKAERERRYGWKCEICGSGFTERGIKQHQARSAWCSREIAKRKENASA